MSHRKPKPPKQMTGGNQCAEIWKPGEGQHQLVRHLFQTLEWLYSTFHQAQRERRYLGLNFTKLLQHTCVRERLLSQPISSPILDYSILWSLSLLAFISGVCLYQNIYVFGAVICPLSPYMEIYQVSDWFLDDLSQGVRKRRQTGLIGMKFLV